MNPETRFYKPVKDFFTSQGFTVKGEVRGCDLVAVKNEQLVVVEFKNRFSLQLLLQAVDRLSITDLVFVAVPVPRRYDSRWRRLGQLCWLLGLGLITVDFSALPPLVILESGGAAPRVIQRRKKLQELLTEFNDRQGDPNPGGSRGEILTAYRQRALAAARLLENGPCRLADLRNQAGQRVTGILQKNHYGWFNRISRGVYALTEKGREAIREDCNRN